MVPSAPLGYLLRAAGVSAVDLFSLDVEGSELRVLQTLEHPGARLVHRGAARAQDGAAIAAIMQRRGYRREHWRVKVHGGIDHLWVRRLLANHRADRGTGSRGMAVTRLTGAARHERRGSSVALTLV